MQGTIIEITDHPLTNQKRKVEITGLGISFKNEIIGLETICTYYDNVDGAYGEPVSIPQPIVYNRTLVAQTKGDNVVYVQSTTGQPVVKKTRQIEESIPAEEQEVDGPTTRLVDQEYWTLKSDEVTEIPEINIITNFAYLVYIIKNKPIILEQLMIQYVLDEVLLGTYDQIAR